MNNIIFQQIKYENLNSVGSHPIEIDLTRHNQTLVTGKNGSGKTTLLAAIAYALFGKSYDGATIGSLVNTFNRKKLLVYLTFETKGKTYTIIRGQKPNVFEIHEDDKLIESEAAKKDYQKFLESILGFDFNIFNHTIGLSAEKYKPFFDLPEGEKRVLIEDVLGLGIFTSMNNIVKKQIKEDDKLKNSKEHEINILKTKLQGLESVVEREKENNTAEIQSLSEEIVQKTSDIKWKKTLLSDVQIDVDNTKSKVEKNKEIRDKIKDVKLDAVSVTKEIARLTKELSFYQENDICPTCKQSIDANNAEVKAVIEEFESSVSSSKFTLEKLSKRALRMLNEVDEAAESFYTIKVKELKEAEQDILLIEHEVANNKRKVKSLIQSAQTSTAVQKDQKAIKVLKDKIHLAELEYEDLMYKIERYNKYHILLKDQGVKSKIISSYLPTINKTFNKYLSSMGYAVNILIDSTFKEKVVMPGKEGFKYKNFSRGQRTRVNLALLLTLLVISRERNSVSTNLLFLDEVLENVDSSGVEDISRLLEIEFSDKNIYITSQRKDEFSDLFRGSINFELDNGFTILTK